MISIGAVFFTAIDFVFFYKLLYYNYISITSFYNNMYTEESLKIINNC